MEKFTAVSSVVAPFPMKDVDTDVIIPAQYLTSTSKAGFGAHVFERVRGSDPKFCMNDPEFKEAKILAVGDNFGCGSSREHAVWALMGAGFKVIIGSSFADIFSGNSAKSGLLLVKLTESEMAAILKAAESGSFSATVDLERQEVKTSDNQTYSFPYDPFRKSCLLDGHDDLDYLLSHKNEIAAHFATKEPVRL